MTHIDGFILAVKKENKQKFIDHALMGDSMFLEMGATRVVECWAEDVPHGKVTDFYGAVKAAEDEEVVFSWIEWPDKGTRDAAHEKMMSENDPRMNPDINPMPFDGTRMIFGGFTPVVDLGA